MKITKPVRRGVSILEVVVVIAILGLLIGLMLVAISNVRIAAVRLQSINNQRQIILSFHQLLDQQSNQLKRMPDGSHMQIKWTTDSTIFYQLLPWTYGERKCGGIEMSLTEIIDCIHPDVPLYISPGDPSLHINPYFETKRGKCSYVYNILALNKTFSFPFQVPDGTSQTIAFGEHYYYCKGNEQYLDYMRPFALSEIEKLGSDRRPTFADLGSYDVMPITENGQSRPSVAGVTFQSRPKIEDANSKMMQSPFAAGLPVAMFDGSVRTLAPNIAESVYWGLITPSGGEVLGDY